VVNTGNPGVRASIDGSKLTLTADRDTRGVKASFRLVVSDISSSDPPPSRRAEGSIQFQVVGRPSAPGEPRPYPLSDQVGTITMSWKPPDDDGGAPILFYWVKEEKSGDRQKCDTNECVFRKLKTGGNYSFRAQAVNRVGESDWSDLSRSAQADTAPGRVQNIRLKDRGDGTITVAWDKPATNTSKILDYTITWVGSSGQDVVPGDRTEFTATGLNNNENYIFTIKAHNRVDYSLPRSSPEMQPLGTPPAPAAPVVTDLEAGANQTNLRISWQAVLPEGPGPTAYTVSYSNGTTTGAVPGCQKLVALTCTHSGVPYDGLTYTYRVVAANQPVGEPGNRSVPSEGTSIEAVGRPAAWGAFQVYATGNSQEAEVQYTVPDSRGTTSRVDILVGGLVARTYAQQTGPFTARVPTASNEQPYQVQLRVCNEKAPAGCTLSAIQTVQTYGPLNNSLNDVATAAVNGADMTWTISGTSNGNPAELAIKVDGGQETVIPLNGVGGFSVPFSTRARDWEIDVTIEVTLRDPSPGNRGTDYSRNTTRSGPPPPPTVRSFRSPCNDANSSPLPACTGKTDLPVVGCQLASCGFLVVMTQDLRNQTFCHVIRGGRVDDTLRVNDNNTQVRGKLYSDGYVEVICDDDGGGARQPGSTGNIEWTALPTI